MPNEFALSNSIKVRLLIFKQDGKMEFNDLPLISVSFKSTENKPAKASHKVILNCCVNTPYLEMMQILTDSMDKDTILIKRDIKIADQYYYTHALTVRSFEITNSTQSPDEGLIDTLVFECLN